jgi:hypothetical protein
MLGLEAGILSPGPYSADPERFFLNGREGKGCPEDLPSPFPVRTIDLDQIMLLILDYGCEICSIMCCGYPVLQCYRSNSTTAAL